MTAKKLLTGLFAAVMTAGAFAPAVVYAQQTSYKDAIKAYNSGNKEAALEIALDYKYGWDGASRNGDKAISRTMCAKSSFSPFRPAFTVPRIAKASARCAA